MSNHPIHDERFPNGLRVLLRPVHTAPVVALQVWANVGSADERPGEEGLAHFHEHMLFKGTARRGVGAVAGDVEGAGGRVNAYTSYDLTVYHVTLPKSATALGLDVLADAVQHSQFDPDEIGREIEVVLEEIRRSEDSPGHVLGNAIFAEAYQSHPYRAPILGTPESVASFNREKVTQFFKRWYAPDNLTVIAAGDFEARELSAAIRDAFDSARPSGVRRERPVEAVQDRVRTTVVRRPFERANLEMGPVTLSLGDPDTPYLDLLAFILGEGDSSRLVRRVKDAEQLVNRIDASSYTPLDPGMFACSADVEPEKAAGAIEAIAREMERLRKEPISSDELEKARANFLSNEHFERESVSGMARKLGSFELMGGGWQIEERYFEALRTATPDDLHRVARRCLHSERITVGAVLPEASDVVLDHDSIVSAIERGCDRTRRTFAVPTRLPQRSDVHSYTLPGGAQLHVVPRTEIPVVAVRAAFLGGLLAETEEVGGITTFLTQLWMRGTRGRTAAGLAQAIESNAIDIDGYSGRNSLGLTLDATSDRLDAGLNLFAEILLEPALDPDEIERDRKDLLAALVRREDSLGARAFDLFLANQFPNHPYRIPLPGTAESITAIDRDALVAHHTRLISAQNLVIGACGAVDPDALAMRIGSLLSDLPEGEGKPRMPDPDPEPHAPTRAELRKDRAQAHMVMGFRGLTVTDEDRFALEVVSQLLAGQGGRLFLELRDRQSLAYSVSASNVEGLAPGFFATYIATGPEKFDAAHAGMLEELERARSVAPDANELARAKQHLIGSFAIDEQRSATRAAHLALDGIYGLGPDADRSYCDAIAHVTADDVLRVAQRIINLDAYTLAVIRP